MKTFFRVSLFLVALAGWLAPAQAASEIEGILITASNRPGATDPRLAEYEPTLRRILRFESYEYIGGDRRGVPEGESQRLSLGGGHRLEVTHERSDERSLHVKVRWIANSRTLMNTGLVLRPGVPAVLGGPSTGSSGDVFAVILVAQ